MILSWKRDCSRLRLGINTAKVLWLMIILIIWVSMPLRLTPMLLENGKTSVPIEDGSSAPGAGSVGSHWKEGTFDDELMTPIANGSNSMGDMTIAAMKDLGYQINPIETRIRTQLEKGIWDGEDQLHNFQSGGLVFDNTPFGASVSAFDVAGLPETHCSRFHYGWRQPFCSGVVAIDRSAFIYAGFANR